MTLFKNDNDTSHVSNVVSVLLAKSGVRVTKTSVKETLENHPDYPSLLSISDSLGVWGIESRSFKVSDDKLPQIPVPFVANMQAGSHSFVTVTDVSDTEVTYFDPSENKMLTGSPDEFKSLWNGVALIVEATNLEEEKDYTNNRQKEKLASLRLPFAFASTCLLLLCFIVSAFLSASAHPVWMSLLSIIFFTGCMVASVLLFYEIDKSNALVQQICSASGKSDCTAVLDSKGAKLFNWLSWSEIGFFYFTGNFLFLLLAGEDSTSMFILAAINALSLPYTFFSVYYQWRVVRQWCVLCLTVQALLVAAFVCFIFLVWNDLSEFHLSGSSHLVSSFLAAFLIPVVFWAVSKPYFLKAKAGDNYKSELNRLKYNYNFFETLLSTQKQIEEPALTLGIRLGNPDGNTHLVTASNPYCAPCSQAHVTVNELLARNPDLSVQIIFTATNRDEDNRKEPVKHLLSIYRNHDAGYFHKVLDDWYASEPKDYEVFAKKYPLRETLNIYEEEVNDMSHWCDENEIDFTPAFFINGRQLPVVYAPSDMTFFLSGE